MFAAVVNKDIASYLPEHHEAVMVKVIKRPVPVSGLFLAPARVYYGNETDSRNNMTCLTNFHQNIVVDAQLDYMQPINVSMLEDHKVQKLSNSLLIYVVPIKIRTPLNFAPLFSRP